MKQQNVEPAAAKTSALERLAVDWRSVGRHLSLYLCAAFLAAGTLAGASIQFEATQIGTTGGGDRVFQYSYFVDGTFSVNQELDIRFDPALYRDLSNAVAEPGFDVLLFQPNNPPGSFGDFSALALVNNPSLAQPFRVDVTYLGSGQPGAQPFFINTFNSNGQIIGSESGFTTPPSGDAVVPEPGTRELSGVALIVVCAYLLTLRRARLT